MGAGLALVESVGPVQWLFQPIQVPLIGLIVALLLPAAYFAKVARKLIEEKFGLNGN